MRKWTEWNGFFIFMLFIGIIRHVHAQKTPQRKCINGKDNTYEEIGCALGCAVNLNKLHHFTRCTQITQASISLNLLNKYFFCSLCGNLNSCTYVCMTQVVISKSI